jgi:hypothetical protein
MQFGLHLGEGEGVNQLISLMAFNYLNKDTINRRARKCDLCG